MLEFLVTHPVLQPGLARHRGERQGERRVGRRKKEKREYMQTHALGEGGKMRQELQ